MNLPLAGGVLEYALDCNMKKAIEIETQVLTKSPDNSDFEARLAVFQTSSDCTGMK